MLISQNNTENNLKSQGMKTDEYGVAPVPVFEGSRNPIMTHVAGINVSVFENSEHKDAALAFVKFLTSPEQQVALNQEFGSLPVVKEAQSDPAFTGNAEPEDVQRDPGRQRRADARDPAGRPDGDVHRLGLKGLIATAASKGSVSAEQVKAALTDGQREDGGPPADSRGRRRRDRPRRPRRAGRVAGAGAWRAPPAALPAHRSRRWPSSC